MAVAGSSLWIGHDFQLVGGPLIFIQRWYGLRSLLAFDIVGNIPIHSTVTHAELGLYSLEARNGGATTWVYETAGDGVQSWDEGTADAPGTRSPPGPPPPVTNDYIQSVWDGPPVMVADQYNVVADEFNQLVPYKV